MIKMYDIPYGLNEIISKYGDPGKDKLDRNWYEKNTGIFELPVSLRLSWNPVKETRYIRAHNEVGLAIVDAISEIAWFYGTRFEKYNHYGGVFNFRKKRGSEELSVHSWGIAIDLNPQLGHLGCQEDAGTYPQPIVDIFKERGFIWGGDWAYPDAMHFQAAEGY